MTGLSSESGYDKVIYWVASPFFGSLLSIYWGVKIAPSNKKIVAIILEVLVIIISVMFFLLSLYVKKDGIVWPLLSTLSFISGASYFLYQYYENGENYNPFS